MSGFSNEVIKAPNSGKPHIVKIDGLWRVSPLPKYYSRSMEFAALWHLAHDFAGCLNQPLLDKLFIKELAK